jgi:hypothetical protein
MNICDVVTRYPWCISAPSSPSSWPQNVSCSELECLCSSKTRPATCGCPLPTPSQFYEMNETCTHFGCKIHGPKCKSSNQLCESEFPRVLFVCVGVRQYPDYFKGFCLMLPVPENGARPASQAFTPAVAKAARN